MYYYLRSTTNSYYHLSHLSNITLRLSLQRLSPYAEVFFVKFLVCKQDIHTTTSSCTHYYLASRMHTIKAHDGKLHKGGLLLSPAFTSDIRGVTCRWQRRCFSISLVVRVVSIGFQGFLRTYSNVTTKVEHVSECRC